MRVFQSGLHARDPRHLLRAAQRRPADHLLPYLQQEGIIAFNPIALLCISNLYVSLFNCWLVYLIIF